MQKVAGLILAAGASSRMGSPKPLLKIDDKTLLEDQVSRIREAGIKNIYVVVGCKAKEIKDIHNDLDVIWVENKNWERGKFSTVLCGLTLLGSRFRGNDLSGVLLLPVDVPFVPPAIIRQIITEGLKRDKNIIPTFQGNGGHPVFLNYRLAQSILKNQDSNNRLDLILKKNADTEKIPIISREILNNVNTIDEWERLNSYPQLPGTDKEIS